MMGKDLRNIFGGLLRAATPYEKGSTAGKRALKTGLAVAGDVLGGKSIKTLFKRGPKRAGGELLDDLVLVMSSKPKRAKNIN